VPSHGEYTCAGGKFFELAGKASDIGLFVSILKSFSSIL